MSIDVFPSIVGTIVFGVVVYHAMSAYHARRGLDMSLAVKEILPE